MVGSVLQAVAATVIAYVPWLPLFLLLRFVIGFVTGGQMTSSFVLLMEMIGKKWRVTIGTIYQVPTWFGHLSLAAIGYLVRDWHHSQLIVGVPSFIFITYIWLIPESPRFLVAHGKIDKAVAVMEMIARKNKLPTEAIAGDVAAYASQIQQNNAQRGKFADLFRPRPICMRTLVLVTNWIAVGVCFYGVAQYAGQRKGDIFQNIAISAAMEIPGTFVAVFLVSKFGRKWTTVLTCTMSGLPMFVIPFLNEGTVAIPIMALISMFGLAGLFATVYVYSGELYPTFIRSIGVGFVSMTCRIGTVSAPFIASLGEYDFAEWLPPLIFGTFPIISGALALYLPETKNDKLADTLEDALRLGKKKSGVVPVQGASAKDKS